MNSTGLDFEKPILELERKIEELRTFSVHGAIDLTTEIKQLEERLEHIKKDVFQNLTPWQRIQIARHPKRPFTLDYIDMIVDNFIEIHGDRLFFDDKALLCGFGTIGDHKMMIMGHQKGRDTKENLMRNFGSAHPEGYRKALRCMRIAERFGLPVVVLIDTPGAYPGIGAEERGQAMAIAENILQMFQIKVPIIVTVIGEGGSGGALGIGIGDRVFVFENAYYSVISPEGCAAILWKDRARAPEAAAALKLTGHDLLKMGIIDDIISEPMGGAHRQPDQAAAAIKKVIIRSVAKLMTLPTDELLTRRFNKFRALGLFTE